MVVRPQFFVQSRRQPAHMLNGLILKTLGEARSEAIVEQEAQGTISTRICPQNVPLPTSQIHEVPNAERKPALLRPVPQPFSYAAPGIQAPNCPQIQHVE